VAIRIQRATHRNPCRDGVAAIAGAVRMLRADGTGAMAAGAFTVWCWHHLGVAHDIMAQICAVIPRLSL